VPSIFDDSIARSCGSDLVRIGTGFHPRKLASAFPRFL